MGSLFSKKNGDTAPPPLHQMNSDTQEMPDPSSYEAACQLDPDLQSFDSTLRQRTSRVINTLAVGVEVRSLSLDSLREVTGCLLEMNEDVVKVILECRKDIWKTKELFELVEDYFENSRQTLGFCTVLEKCLKRAREGQLIIQFALKQFEEDQREGIDGAKKNYSKTLQELKNFRAAGDPFTEEFFLLFQSVYKQQVSMLKTLQIKKSKLDKKLKSVKSWWRVSNIILGAAFASVLICSVVAAAIAAPPVVTALAAAAASVPFGSMGNWINSLWKKYENELKEQREIMTSMWIVSDIAIKDLVSIRVLVDKLEIKIESMLQNADFALRDEDVVMLAIDEIKKKLCVFMQTIEDLSEHADTCSRHIRRQRTVILRRITKYPTY